MNILNLGTRIDFTVPNAERDRNLTFLWEILDRKYPSFAEDHEHNAKYTYIRSDGSIGYKVSDMYFTNGSDVFERFAGTTPDRFDGRLDQKELKTIFEKIKDDPHAKKFLTFHETDGLTIIDPVVSEQKLYELRQKGDNRDTFTFANSLRTYVTDSYGIDSGCLTQSEYDVVLRKL